MPFGPQSSCSSGSTVYPLVPQEYGLNLHSVAMTAKDLSQVLLASFGSPGRGYPKRTDLGVAYLK